MKKTLFYLGIFVTIVAAGMWAYIFLASDNIGRDSYELYVNLQNANGLLVDASVYVSGVKVGRIKRLELVNKKVRLTLEIRKDVVIYSEDILKRVPQGILGASVLNFQRIEQGTILQDGDLITRVEDTTFIETLTGSSGNILRDVEGISGTIEDYLQNSEILSQVNEIAQYLESTLKNISEITKDLAKSSEVNAQSIQAMIQAVTNITGVLEQFIANDKTADDQKFSDSLEAIKISLQNIQKITEGLSSGEGTLGKLLSDDKLYDDAALAIENVNKVTQRAAGLSTTFMYNYEGLISETGAYTSRNHVNLSIQPKESPRKYIVGITIGGPENFDDTPQYSASISDSSIKLNLMLAHSFAQWVSVYGGLLENTGGFGVSFQPISQLKFSTEAFDFGGGNAGILLRANTYIYPFFDPTNMRNPLKWLYIGAGVDDILDSYERNYYFGVGISITDEFIYDAIRLVPLASATTAIAN